MVRLSIVPAEASRFCERPLRREFPSQSPAEFEPGRKGRSRSRNRLTRAAPPLHNSWPGMEMIAARPDAHGNLAGHFGAQAAKGPSRPDERPYEPGPRPTPGPDFPMATARAASDWADPGRLADSSPHQRDSEVKTCRTSQLRRPSKRPMSNAL